MTAWHSTDRDGALQHFDVRDHEGLSESEVLRQREHFGANRLPSPPRPGFLLRFLRQFHNLLIYVLLAASLLTALLGHFVDTIVILAVVLVNATIGFIQEGKAESALAAIRDMLAPRATVLRDGRRIDVGSDEVVPGDVVFLEAGSRVPADLRLLEVRSLRVEEAALTGESVPVDKQSDPVDANAALGDRRSMAFAGTLARAGQARGLVVATGGHTELGRISGMIADVPVVETPLLRQMGIFARWLTLVILGVGAVILAVGVSLGAYPFAELFMMLVGLSVAAIPEGLPAILTVTLAIGVQAMARRNAIVRRLPAIEALGAVSVICSDKTGTLTKNEMTVTRVVTAEHGFDVTGSGYEPHGGFALDGGDADIAAFPQLQEIGRAALLCNDAELRLDGDSWTISGDPMEAALLVLAAKAGLEARDERAQRPRLDAIPFDSAHRFMASLHHDHDGGGMIYVKGAPEVMISRCSQAMAAGGPIPMDAAYWHEEARSIASRGRRVLALAAKPRSSHESELVFGEVDDGLIMLGLLGLMDPPRDEAVESVRRCLAAGIRVKMITGDHADTAAAIGRQLGLQNTDEVLEGEQLDDLDDPALRLRAREVDVFARTSPEHKLRLVKALQDAGEVVAMTGDGVNDAPALKRADIGVAMGGKGTEAAKEASEMVLADDNFATIVAAVDAGRTVYDNLKKAIVFLLPVNGGESLSLVAALLFGLTLPITPVQILWVNMVSSVVLAMTLAFEPGEKNIMERPPRPRDEPIMAPFVLWRVAFVSVLFMAGIFGKFALAEAQGASVEEARTIAVNTLIAMEIFYLFAVRYMNGASITLRGILGTPAVLIAIAIVTVLQLVFTYVPFMETFFGTRPLSLAQLAQIALVGVAVLGVLEAEKLAVRALRRLQGPARDRLQRTVAGTAVALVLAFLLGVISVVVYQKAAQFDAQGGGPTLKEKVMAQKAHAMEGLVSAIARGDLSRASWLLSGLESSVDMIEGYLETDMYAAHGAAYREATLRLGQALERRDWPMAKEATLAIEKSCLDCHQVVLGY